jgi:Phosphoglyceromutase
MQDHTSGQPHTAHTTGPVPIWLAADPIGVQSLQSGALQDVAPTLLDLLGLEQPVEMTGHSLITR